MIYCPTCHLANRDGSRFCNECGTNLQGPGSSVAPANVEPPAAHEAPGVVASDAEARVPDWMREIQQAAQIAHAPIDTPPAASQPTAAAAREPSAPTADDNLPSWLRDVATPSAAPFEPMAESGSLDHEPALISAQNQPTRAVETPPTQPTVEPTDWSDVPEWVRQLRTGSAVEATAETPSAFAAEAPAWLADLPAAAAASIETPTALPVVERSASAPVVGETADLAPGDLPDWLKGLAPHAAVTPGQADWAMSDVAVEELPDWLKPGAVQPPTPSDAQAVGLAPGEIPPWLLALRPGGLATVGGDMLETSGLLAGISGALPVESVLAMPHKSIAQLPAPSAVSETGFTHLSAPQPTPPRDDDRPSPQKKKTRWSWRNLLPWLILSAAATAFLPLPFIDSARGANLSGHQPASNFYQAINQVSALRPNSLVLVAFDYRAGARDELDPQAKTTLLHLFENKQRIIALSFAPTGGQLAQDALASRNPANTGVSYPYNYGETHVNVGYVSGETAAMQSLAQNFVPSAFTDFRERDSAGNKPIAKDWQSWDDVDLIIVFSDDGAQIKNWIEQVVVQANQPTKLLLVGASAAAAPTVLPYYDATIKGYLSGVRGAAEYEGFLAQPATASARLDSTAYVVVVLVGVIAVSLVATLFARGARGAA